MVVSGHLTIRFCVSSWTCLVVNGSSASFRISTIVCAASSPSSLLVSMFVNWVYMFLCCSNFIKIDRYEIVHSRAGCLLP